MKNLQTRCCSKSAFLKIGLFLILSFFMAVFYSEAQADDFNISASNYGRYYLFHNTKADSTADRFQFDLSMNKFYAGAWFEVKHSETANRTIDSITQRYFGWEDNGLTIHAGTFYQVFDRGLILNTYRDENVQVDIPLEGVRVSGRYKYIDFDALSGSHKTENIDVFGRPQKPIIRGAHFKVRPLKFFQLGGGYVRVLESDAIINLRSNSNEFNARLNYKNFDWYTEYATRDGYRFDFSGDTAQILGRDGNGLYSSFTVNYWKLAGLFEYKNYNQLIDNASISSHIFNQPPAENHQERSLLSSPYYANKEEGWRAGLNFSPSLFWIGSVEYSQAKSRDLDRPKYFMNEFYAELHGNYLWGNPFILSFDRLKHWEENEITPKIELNYTLNDMNSFILDLSRTKYIVYQQREINGDSQDSTGKFISLEYDRGQRYSLTIGGSWMDKNIDSGIQADPKELLYIEGMLKFPNHDLTLFYGGQRGGTVCSGGVCTTRPTFRGLKASLISRF
jgi:hypothetical protein